MQRYLNQLIEDMHLAATLVSQSRIPETVFDPNYMMELEAMEELPMSEWFGLSKEQFPPADRLDAGQQKQMAEEFEKLWAAFSFDPYFPEGLPARRRYELMRDYLDHKCTFWPGGWIHTFEFCNYEPDHCPFGNEYCRCKDFEYDKPAIMNKVRESEDDLPF